MKIYTRTGDTGTTGLFGGDRVSKHHPRIHAYGTVDEVNAFLGVVRVHAAAEDTGRFDALLARLQEDLFVLGADLATPRDSRAHVPRITKGDIEQLERWIDAFDEELPPLRHFILPGGTPAAAALHVARTVCRRAERLTVEAGTQGDINPLAPVYLNRLSDLLFVLARWANAQGKVDEALWQPSERTPGDPLT